MLKRFWWTFLAALSIVISSPRDWSMRLRHWVSLFHWLFDWRVRRGSLEHWREFKKTRRHECGTSTKAVGWEWNGDYNRDGFGRCGPKSRARGYSMIFRCRESALMVMWLATWHYESLQWTGIKYAISAVVFLGLTSRLNPRIFRLYPRAPTLLKTGARRLSREIRGLSRGVKPKNRTAEIAYLISVHCREPWSRVAPLCGYCSRFLEFSPVLT
jgi:hypothetical protein